MDDSMLEKIIQMVLLDEIDLMNGNYDMDQDDLEKVLLSKELTEEEAITKTSALLNNMKDTVTILDHLKAVYQYFGGNKNDI